MSSKSFTELVHSRRSVRRYNPESKFDHHHVQQSLELATLSPNSSNMQMWAFHRVVSKETKTKLAELCMGQNAAKTANELVVFVATPDNWKERAKMNAGVVKRALQHRNDHTAKKAMRYYEKLIPFVYRNDVFGLLGVARKVYAQWLGRNRPMVREVSKQDVRVCLHKSVSLAAMTFMYAMQEKGYDTCPMEGFDSYRVKKLLGLKRTDQICMIVSCGVKADDGVYSERHRVDSDTVIFTH